MEEMEEHTKRVSKMKQVILEKTSDRVIVKGPYTKRGLRQLLLSSISLPALRDDEIDETLRETGLSQSDLEKLKEGKPREISEQGKEKLEGLEITDEMIEEALKSQQDGEKVIEEHKTDPREEIQKFLREKALSESLIKTLLAVGLTDEFIRLLKALGLTDEDIAELMRLFQIKRKDEEEEDDSFASLAFSSEEYLSPDGLYLKSFLSKPLADALHEIVAKKPFDPVEYLAHWLLHYKVCEERDTKRREFDLELMIERERVKMRLGATSSNDTLILYKKDVEDEVSVSIKRGEEEEFVEDWNYINYEG